jgi:hypothetical protein
MAQGCGNTVSDIYPCICIYTPACLIFQCSTPSGDLSSILSVSKVVELIGSTATQKVMHNHACTKFLRAQLAHRGGLLSTVAGVETVDLTRKLPIKLLV